MTDSSCPPVQLKIASRLHAMNPRGTIYEIISVFHFFKKTLLHTIKHTLFMSLCQNTCSDDIKHLHKSKQFQSSYDHFQFHLDSFLPLLFIINALFCKIYFHPVSKWERVVALQEFKTKYQNPWSLIIVAKYYHDKLDFCLI